jgi:Carbohydrate family 9 binding domain-like
VIVQLSRRSFLVVPLAAALVLSGVPAPASPAQPKPRVDFERLPYAPLTWVAQRATSSVVVDGRLDEAMWKATSPSERFIDIEGDRKPALDTWMKMLWDDRYLYIGADLQEPHVWGTLTARDSVIFQDNDFEVFIDPDGDTHNYYEIEINALGTVWDLLLVQPYRDGGPAIHAWDIAGLQSAVNVRGTLNQPADLDEGWSVEMAIPWEILREAAPGKRAAQPGDVWRVNFSRVQWDTEIVDGKYVKVKDPKTGKPFPEHNWVWSPQGAINMHMPERWGYLHFSNVPPGEPAGLVARDRNEDVEWALRRLYYRQRDYRAAHGRYASDLAALRAETIAVDGLNFRPMLSSTESQYEIRAEGFQGAVVRIRQDGKVSVERLRPERGAESPSESERGWGPASAEK